MDTAPPEPSRVEDSVTKAVAIEQSARGDAQGVRSLLMNASEIYEKDNDASKAQATQASLGNTGLSVVNEGMRNLGLERRRGAEPEPEDLKEQVMLYTPGGASMESGIQFIPHQKVGADMKEQAVVDSTNVQSLLEAQYSRVVMPRNGRVRFADAVVNNVITETAEQPVMTRFRGKENIGIDAELKYHPLGYESAQTNNKNIWAYRKEDLFLGIQQNAVLTSNIEYLPQQAQMGALEMARDGDGAVAALAKLYGSSVDLAEFDALRPPVDANLDSSNPLPAPDVPEGAAEFTDDLDMQEVDRIVSEARQLNGTSGTYAPRIEEWYA